MNAREVLDLCESMGVRLAVDGEKISVRGAGEHRDRIVEAVRANKAELLDTLRDDIVEAWQERAAIMEHEAGMARADAEQAATASTAERLGKPRFRVWAVRMLTDGRQSHMTLIDTDAMTADEMRAELGRRFGADRVLSVELRGEVTS